MGHFGMKPIRLAWFTVVLPALLLNYFGQGALLLENPAAAENPFYRLVPSWGLYPMVILATAAAVIASQAVITGAFSLTMQAVQLGFMPASEDHAHFDREFGQIYIPAVNWALMFGCIAIVVGFRTSSNLAAAYGIAVTSTMVITTILLYVVARDRWGWSSLTAASLCAFFLSHRSRVLRREYHQGRAWRMVPAAARGSNIHGDDDVEEGAEDPVRANPGGCSAAGGLSTGD